MKSIKGLLLFVLTAVIVLACQEKKKTQSTEFKVDFEKFTLDNWGDEH